MKTTQMEPGWYLNGGKAWYWDGEKFSDKLDENCAQHQYIEYVDDEDRERAEQELRDATAQVGDVFIHLNGPYEFDQICDGLHLLDPNEDPAAHVYRIGV